MGQDQDSGTRREPRATLDNGRAPTAETHGVDKGPKLDARAEDLAALPTETAAPLDPAPRSLPAKRVALGVGSTLKHYEILRKLGEGGMGAVFLARDTKLGRLAAIKVLLKQSGRSAARFLLEAQATARCKHENIVVIYEVDELDECPYMVLEYLDGKTLREWMTDRTLHERTI